MLFEHANRSHLIVDSDLDLLFGRRNDFVFLLARKGWELLKRLLDDIKSTLDLSFRDDQGRCETNDVFVGWLGLYHLKLAFCSNQLIKEKKKTYQQSLALHQHAQVPG